MPSDSTRPWSARRTTTNGLLGLNVVVLAAGFIAVGNVGPRSIQWLSELLLVLVVFVAAVLGLGWLVRSE
ncbi:hypothetical protein [Natrinema sp. 1APR25-10V2]|uniref:hypothetical protein n=1 Tax=Natrinema sp. 1APR25-10V2 TaxID=2951081 RepID=UPI00287563B1|nr:hypothetical protein [Natrinema sp. 1APR25-10V2]MDS0478511.1 hypothetical protein [Natrinema sp. 1APR25-10V2]